MNVQIFQDRRDAGRKLALALSQYKESSDVVVLALPRGGVPVAYEVARALSTPLDVFVVRKLGVPGHEEVAMGAVATGGVRILYHPVLWELGIPDGVIDAIAAEKEREVMRMEKRYRGDRPPVNVHGENVIVVDDGIATGSSARAAITALRARKPARIVLAVPVAPAEACEELESEVDELVCLAQPKPFVAVGQWYWDFGPVSDEEVSELLEKASLQAVRG